MCAELPICQWNSGKDEDEEALGFERLRRSARLFQVLAFQVRQVPARFETPVLKEQQLAGPEANQN